MKKEITYPKSDNVRIKTWNPSFIRTSFWNQDSFPLFLISVGSYMPILAGGRVTYLQSLKQSTPGGKDHIIHYHVLHYST